MAQTHLTVHYPDHQYPVIFEAGALAGALPRFVQERGFRRSAVITNTTLAPLYGEQLATRLPGGFVITVPDGEHYKTLETVRDIYGQLLERGADRSTLIVALGGGVIGDMAGFAAATFMRGVALVQAPTSLLAMVDASIGGKVGVDLPQGKNLVGAFKDPLAVFADPTVLRTLPAIEFRCGLAEVIKAGLIDDRPLLEIAATCRQDEVDRVTELAARAAAVKIGIVEHDRLESGSRVFLNLGHTFAHALEQASDYRWKHGEAVAVGLVAAARLSELRGLCPPGLAQHVEHIVQAAGLPVRYADLSPDVLWEAMRHDKKWREGEARFVLLAGVGHPVSVSGVPRTEVLEILAGLREGG